MWYSVQSTSVPSRVRLHQLRDGHKQKSSCSSRQIYNSIPATLTCVTGRLDKNVLFTFLFTEVLRPSRLSKGAFDRDIFSTSFMEGFCFRSLVASIQQCCWEDKQYSLSALKGTIGNTDGKCLKWELQLKFKILERVQSFCPFPHPADRPVTHLKECTWGKSKISAFESYAVDWSA